MIAFTIFIILLIILLSSAKYKTKIIEESETTSFNRTTKLYRSIDNIDSKIKELERIIESHMVDVPREDVELLENILKEWSEIQRSIYLDQRSWIRDLDSDQES